MANKIIEQTVPRYKINGISTLTFCSTRAISKPSAVCFGNSSNPPLTSPHFGHTVNPSGTELPAIFYHTIEFLADRRRFNPFTKKKSVESFVYPSRGIRRGPETNKQYPSISRTDIAIHGDECSYCHPCFLKIAKFS